MNEWFKQTFSFKPHVHEDNGIHYFFNTLKKWKYSKLDKSIIKTDGTLFV